MNACSTATTTTTTTTTKGTENKLETRLADLIVEHRYIDYVLHSPRPTLQPWNDLPVARVEQQKPSAKERERDVEINCERRWATKEVDDAVERSRLGLTLM